MFVLLIIVKEILKFLLTENCHTFYLHFMTLVFSQKSSSYSQTSKYLVYILFK